MEATRLIPNQGLPTNLKSDIQPVININPKDYRIVSIVRNKVVTNSAVENTIYTTPSDKDFFLTGFVQNGFSNSGLNPTFFLAAFLDGVQRRLSQFIVRDAGSASIMVPMSFNPPIKVDRGTAVSMKCDIATASTSHNISIFGYEVEP